jgi:hypothetical protein
LEIAALRAEHLRMKTVLRVMLLLALSASAVPAAGGQMSAYEALRLVGKEKGQPLLANLVEMRGVDGAPQPAQWILVFRDETARGGVREFSVAGSVIAGERTPFKAIKPGPEAAMSAASLNLDSTGVFTAVNNAASAAKLGFNTIDYRLANAAGKPAWEVKLFDVSGTEVGAMDIAADNGAVLKPLAAASGTGTPAPGPPAPTAEPTAQPTVAPTAAPSVAAAAPDPDKPLGERWVEGGGLVGHAERFGERTWTTTTNTARKVGESLKNFFIGRPPAESGTAR